MTKRVARRVGVGFLLLVMYFLVGEQVTGLNKICYYNGPGGVAAITVKAYQLCPLSIQR